MRPAASRVVEDRAPDEREREGAGGRADRGEERERQRERRARGDRLADDPLHRAQDDQPEHRCARDEIEAASGAQRAQAGRTRHERRDDEQGAGEGMRSIIRWSAHVARRVCTRAGDGEAIPTTS